jgi:hypothetical protein
MHGSAGLSASLYTKCTRFDIIAVLYTCTTVASRVAANARALTHARRSLWHRRLTHHTHTSTHLNVPNLGVLNPWSSLYKLLASSVVILTLLLSPGTL